MNDWSKQYEVYNYSIENAKVFIKIYGKYDDKAHCFDPFAKFLENHCICAQYIMQGTPQQNGVAKRRNMVD